MVNLDIISDPICPWCFIGKTNLEKALEGKVNLILYSLASVSTQSRDAGAGDGAAHLFGNKIWR